MKIELLSLAVNLICTIHYLWRGAEWGKVIYWAGASLLSLGLYRMKG